MPNSYLEHLTESEKKNPATQAAQPASPMPQEDSVSLSAAGMAALNAVDTSHC